MTTRRAAGLRDGVPTASAPEYFPPYRRGRRRGQDGYGGGLVALRGALTMLARAPLGVVTGISVTLDLKGAPGAASRLREVCRGLAEQYGLEVLPRFDGPHCEVRFDRRRGSDGQVQGPGTAQRDL